ncbi:M20/M25/M40 family metallo-hydrolase [Streptomonospora salina]|uniref:Acetylornithine deacetylase/succinyl-diaminopimelate desuccinylase-like protein n=1 Tax=Streptomonospora salina TaxID=104205 RepID=A0A841EFC2_9ACTN|nr:M20/M25/M40 family metallo-hydrolase [Streptomonospora salina]MBB5999753.1 acetylornithine deacetylase/succinyl-diaminopimelate desuccinylase-like protein [Streptomonospora salina]
MTAVALADRDRRLLLRLLELPTAGRLETGPDAAPPRLREAQNAYADAAAELGFAAVHHAPPPPQALERAGVPLAVREAAADHPGLLDAEPSLVLRLGPPRPRAATVMFNVHLDTVAGWEPPRFDGADVYGRGAADATGPAVALLAGVRAALHRDPAIGTAAGTGVLIQAVAGEEGGAMGAFGTRPLVEQGFVGRLNLFCEPTGMRYLPRSTAAMTARVRVAGHDAVDDRPGEGHNATVLLGFLAQYLAARLPARAGGGERMCVGGLHTGARHNRVYGTGELLLNLPYTDTGAGHRLGAAVESVLDEGLAEFSARFAGTPAFALTAADARTVTRLDWLKRGLPTLDCTDPWMHRLLGEDAGLHRWPADEPAFTCDAIWMDGVDGAAAAVLGPGDLAGNNAHADGEFASVGDLEDFAGAVARVLTAFARDHRADAPHSPGHTNTKEGGIHRGSP